MSCKDFWVLLECFQTLINFPYFPSTALKSGDVEIEAPRKKDTVKNNVSIVHEERKTVDWDMWCQESQSLGILEEGMD